MSLTKDIYYLILQELKIKKQIKMRLVCKMFKTLVDEMHKNYAYYIKNLTKMCINRSIDEVVENCKNLKSIKKYSNIKFNNYKINAKFIENDDLSFVKEITLIDTQISTQSEKNVSLKNLINLKKIIYKSAKSTNFQPTLVDFPKTLKIIKISHLNTNSLFFDTGEILNLVNLTDLNIQYPLNKDTDFLKNCKKLITLSLFCVTVVPNSIKNNIKKLSLTNCNILSFDFLLNNKNMTEMKFNKVTINYDEDFSQNMEKLETLKVLELNFTLVKNYKFLSRVKNLENLDLSNNNWVNHDVMTYLMLHPKLKMLNILDTEVISLLAVIHIPYLCILKCPKIAYENCLNKDLLGGIGRIEWK